MTIGVASEVDIVTRQTIFQVGDFTALTKQWTVEVSAEHYCGVRDIYIELCGGTLTVPQVLLGLNNGFVRRVIQAGSTKVNVLVRFYASIDILKT